jgi:hypothetical protein
MPTPEQLKRWQADWTAIVSACGKKVDSFKFEGTSDGTERLTIILHDGLRIGVEASGPLRAWVRRCGQPGDGPGECKA